MVNEPKYFREEFERLKVEELYISNIIDKINFYSNKEAKEMLYELIEFTKKNSLMKAYPWVLYKLGKIYIAEDQVNNADKLFRESYKIFQENNIKEGMLAVINGFMASECMQHKYTSAVQWAIKGIKLADEVNDPEFLIAIKGNLAGIYMAIDEYKKAIEILEEIEQTPWLGTDLNKVAIYLNRVICEQSINNLEKALYYIYYIEEYALKNPNTTVNWLLEKARIYIKKGLYNEAEEMLLECCELCDKIEAHEVKSQVILYLSEIDIINKKYEMAIERLKSIEKKILDDRVMCSMKHMYNYFNLAYKGLEDYKSAYISLEKLTAIERQLTEIKSATIFSVLDEQKKEIVEKNYKLLYEQNKLIYKVGQKIISNLNKNNIFKVIAKEIKNVIKYDIIQIITYNEEKDNYQYQLVIERDKIITLNNKEVYKGGFASYSIRHKEDLIINDIENEHQRYIENFDEYRNYISKAKDWESLQVANSLLFVPMIIKNKVLGVICVQHYEKDVFDLRDLTSLKLLSTYIAIALDNASLYKRVKYNANYDDLTGIFNRRKAIEKINKLKDKSRNFNEDYYIAMIDIDNFKKINDVYGHIAGDRILIEIAATIRNSIGENDIVGRYGGEEFIVIVKENNGNLTDIIEGIRRNIEDLNIKIDNRNVIKVTASIGVKRFDINNRTLEENIALADKSLYKAKTLGKNKVVY